MRSRSVATVAPSGRVTLMSFPTRCRRPANSRTFTVISILPSPVSGATASTPAVSMLTAARAAARLGSRRLEGRDRRAVPGLLTDLASFVDAHVGEAYRREPSEVVGFEQRTGRASRP